MSLKAKQNLSYYWYILLCVGGRVNRNDLVDFIYHLWFVVLFNLVLWHLIERGKRNKETGLHKFQNNSLAIPEQVSTEIHFDLNIIYKIISAAEYIYIYIYLFFFFFFFFFFFQVGPTGGYVIG